MKLLIALLTLLAFGEAGFEEDYEGLVSELEKARKDITKKYPKNGNEALRTARNLLEKHAKDKIAKKQDTKTKVFEFNLKDLMESNPGVAAWKEKMDREQYKEVKENTQNEKTSFDGRDKVVQDIMEALKNKLKDMTPPPPPQKEEAPLNFNENENDNDEEDSETDPDFEDYDHKTFKRGKADLTDGYDTIPFQWDVPKASLTPKTEKKWDSMDGKVFDVNDFPELRRMFDGHAIAFFDPENSESEPEFKRRARKIAKRLLENKPDPEPHLEIFGQTDEHYYRGTPSSGYLSLPEYSYTGQIEIDPEKPNEPTPHGFGHLQTPNTTFTGKFKNGHPHGRGISRGPNKCQYRGEFQTGQRHGEGTLNCSCGGFSGSWHHDKYHGRGVLMSSPCKISAWWDKGVPSEYEITCNGERVSTAPKRSSEDTFEGHVELDYEITFDTCPFIKWKNGRIGATKPVGLCNVTLFPMTYTGTCHGEKLKGYGTLTDPKTNTVLSGYFDGTSVTGTVNGTLNGNPFHGTLEKTLVARIGAAHGEGNLTIISPGESIQYTGKVKQGVPHGKGVLTYLNGNRTSSVFYNGTPNGNTVFYTAESILYVAVRFGRKEGWGVYRKPSGVKTSRVLFTSDVIMREETEPQSRKSIWSKTAAYFSGYAALLGDEAIAELMEIVMILMFFIVGVWISHMGPVIVIQIPW